MSYAIEFVIAGLPDMSNKLLRGHWKARYGHAKKWKALTARAVFLNGVKPAQPLVSAALRLTRRSSVEPDHDGLVSGFKHVIDGLVECGILKSDKPSCVRAEYFWEYAPKRKGSVHVRVEENLKNDQTDIKQREMG